MTTLHETTEKAGINMSEYLVAPGEYQFKKSGCAAEETEFDEVALYAAPPQREPLSEEEILKISDKIERSDFFEIVIPFARAIEAAHGIGVDDGKQ